MCGYCSSDRICLLASASAAACRAQARARAHSHAHACAYRDITLPYLTLTLTALAFWLFLSLRRYTANCISRMGLRSWWWPCRLPERCTSPAPLRGSPWQALAALGRPRNSGSSTSPAGKTRESVSHTTTPSSQSYDLSPIRSQGSKQRQPCIWGWPDLPKTAYELLNLSTSAAGFSARNTDDA